MAGGNLLRNRDFALVAGSVGLSALGDWVAIVALGLHVKEMTDSGFAVAALWICLFGPSVAVAGPAGLLVDRLEATLKFIETHIVRMMEIWGGIEAFQELAPEAMAERNDDQKLLNGPKLDGEAGHASQDDIDALFN